MVTDISESRLIMWFTEALIEPLRGWVESYRPTTLADAIRRTRDMQDAVPKIRLPPKTNSHIEDEERKPVQKEWMDNNTR